MFSTIIVYIVPVSCSTNHTNLLRFYQCCPHWYYATLWRIRRTKARTDGSSAAYFIFGFMVDYCTMVPVAQLFAILHSHYLQYFVCLLYHGTRYHGTTVCNSLFILFIMFCALSSIRDRTRKHMHGSGTWFIAIVVEKYPNQWRVAA